MLKLFTLFMVLTSFLGICDSILFAQLFAPKVDYTVGPYPFEVESADFNNDGYFDLATTSDQLNCVTILLNNGDGTFASPVNYIVGNDPTLALADFDNDSDVDIAAPSYSDNFIFILLNDGNGNFFVTDTFTSGGFSNQPCAPDLDKDGYFDLAVPNRNAGRIAIFFNNGGTTYTGFSDLFFHGVGNDPYSVRSRDLDNDNDSDLVVPNSNSQSVSVLLNDGTGLNFARTDYTTLVYPHTPSMADYNNDGCLDLAVPNRSVSTPFVSVFMGNCDGTFSQKVDYPGCRPHSVTSADFDLDGFVDLAVPNVDCNSVSIFLNNGGQGDTVFLPHFTLAAGVEPLNAVAVDFDNDGDIDLAVNAYAGAPNNVISIFFNQTNLNSVSNESVFPKTFSLEQNYPNPFNLSTKIKYSIPQSSSVLINVFDMLGNEIETLVNEEKLAGTYEIEFDARGLPSGVYFYQLKAGEFADTKKIILLK